MVINTECGGFHSSVLPVLDEDVWVASASKPYGLVRHGRVQIVCCCIWVIRDLYGVPTINPTLYMSNS